MVKKPTLTVDRLHHPPRCFTRVICRMHSGDTKYVCIMAHYAKDYKDRSAPEPRRVGVRLPQDPRSGRAQPLPDTLAHQQGQEHRPSDGGHRILKGDGSNNSLAVTMPMDHGRSETVVTKIRAPEIGPCSVPTNSRNSKRR